MTVPYAALARRKKGRFLGEDWLLKRGTGVINALRAVRKGNKQGVVLSCCYVLNNPYRLFHGATPFSSGAGQSCKVAVHSWQAPTWQEARRGIALSTPQSA